MITILQNEYIKRFTARGEIFSSQLGRDCLPGGKRPKGETCAKASALACCSFFIPEIFSSKLGKFQV